MRALLFCTHGDAQHNGASTSSPDDRRHTSYFHYTVRAWLHIFSLCMHCERYGAREGRARSEIGEALPAFCRRTYMPAANRFLQATNYTRTRGHGDILSYSRKIKLTSRLVHRHVLGYVGQSAWRVSVLQQNTRIATHRRMPYQ